jgi:hypothetical protein
MESMSEATLDAVPTIAITPAAPVAGLDPAIIKLMLQAMQADDRMRAFLAFTLISMVSAFLAASYFLSPKLPGDTEGMIIGGMLTWVGTLLNYYWGTSSGSKMKGMMMQVLSSLAPPSSDGDAK